MGSKGMERRGRRHWGLKKKEKKSHDRLKGST